MKRVTFPVHTSTGGHIVGIAQISVDVDDSATGYAWKVDKSSDASKIRLFISCRRTNETDSTSRERCSKALGVQFAPFSAQAAIVAADQQAAVPEEHQGFMSYDFDPEG